MLRLPLPKIACQICGKMATTSFSRSHSHKRQKRLYKPNLITHHGLTICTRCLKTQKKRAANYAR